MNAVVILGVRINVDLQQKMKVIMERQIDFTEKENYRNVSFAITSMINNSNERASSFIMAYALMEVEQVGKRLTNKERASRLLQYTDYTMNTLVKYLAYYDYFLKGNIQIKTI